MRAKLSAAVGAVVLCVGGVTAGAVTSSASASASGPMTGLHYTQNGNFDPAGNYLPGSLGFNVADVSSASALGWLPKGVKGLAWVGSCGGADSTFKSKINTYVGKSNLFGFYLMDDADPTGKWKAPACTADSLRAEADYIHATIPGAVAYVLPMNLSSSAHPSFDPSYSSANTHVDAWGIDPYPCRTETGGCDLDMINRYVNAALAAGMAQGDLVPVYQTFGLGGWNDDGGGKYAVPSAAQLQSILDRWATLTPSPKFDDAYSYGVQNSDQALSGLPDLQPVMAAHNGSGDGAAPVAVSSSSKPTPATSSPSASASSQSPQCVRVRR